MTHSYLFLRIPKTNHGEERKRTPLLHLSHRPIDQQTNIVELQFLKVVPDDIPVATKTTGYDPIPSPNLTEPLQARRFLF